MFILKNVLILYELRTYNFYINDLVVSPTYNFHTINGDIL